MPDEAAFLDALRADPTNTTLLLVYADWLEERGDPRPEYVRLTQTPQGNEARIEELRRRLDKEWATLIDRCETPAHELRRIDHEWRVEKAREFPEAIGHADDRSTLESPWQLVLSVLGIISGVGLALLAFSLCLVRENGRVGGFICGMFFTAMTIFFLSVLWLTEIRYRRAWRAYRRRRAETRGTFSQPAFRVDARLQDSVRRRR